MYFCSHEPMLWTLDSVNYCHGLEVVEGGPVRLLVRCQNDYCKAFSKLVLGSIPKLCTEGPVGTKDIRPLLEQF